MKLDSPLCVFVCLFVPVFVSVSLCVFVFYLFTQAGFTALL